MTPSQDGPWLFRAEAVDLVAVSADGVTELYVVQDHPWVDTQEQFESLARKFQAYLSFVLEGSLRATYPQLAERRWRIVYHRQIEEPVPALDDALVQLGRQVANYGGELLVKVGRSAAIPVVAPS